MGFRAAPYRAVARYVASSFAMPDKPSSEQLRREAEKLRETAVDLMEHAALLIEKSADLERRILAHIAPTTTRANGKKTRNAGG